MEGGGSLKLHLLRVIIFSAYVIFISTSSILLEKTEYTSILIVGGSLFIVSIIASSRSLIVRLLQITFLVLFHWYSQLNWCLPLYLLLAANEYYYLNNFKKSILVGLLFGTLYSLIRISYSPAELYTFLITISDLLSFTVFALLIYYIIYSEKSRKLLKQEREQLLKQDSLTGLINFEQCHKHLDELIKNQTRYTFLLIDCQDTTSINHQTYGSEMLVKVAQALDRFLKEADMIARYGGDQFALTIKTEGSEKSLKQIQECLETEISQVLGIMLTYGYASFPKDASTKESLIFAAENNLYEEKRKLWLKREEQMLNSEKLKVVGELAAGMAHEIRNPITTVQGFLQMSKTSDYNIEQWYELMMGEITRVSELTTEFLQFSKPQASQYKKYSFDECIQRVIQLIECEVLAHGHHLKYEPTNAPLIALMDKDKIVQALLNLIKNGIEAMEVGGTLTIRLDRQGNEGIIEFGDTGCGIPEEMVNQLFHPFFTTKENGTGLGLSICHKIIQDHGGTIRVKGNLNKGSVFRITLPLSNNSL
jgi:diguanylate cyclase (GGDEF)-like protein